MNTTTEQLSQKKKRINWKRAEGMKFGKLTVSALLPKVYGKMRRVGCTCECGNRHEVSIGALVGGGCRSCGCLANKTGEDSANYRHGHSAGGSTSKEYRAYVNMHNRCYRDSPISIHYKRKGVLVCDRWLLGEGGLTGVQCFLRDVGKAPTIEHSLERVDNGSSYTPENCVWALRTQQSNNKDNNFRVSWGGSTRTLAEWSRSVGVPYKLLHDRVRKLGWSFDAAISTHAKGAKL